MLIHNQGHANRVFGNDNKFHLLFFTCDSYETIENVYHIVNTLDPDNIISVEDNLTETSNPGYKDIQSISGAIDF